MRTSTSADKQRVLKVICHAPIATDTGLFGKPCPQRWENATHSTSQSYPSPEYFAEKVLKGRTATERGEEGERERERERWRASERDRERKRDRERLTNTAG